jgi:drug/metabolite transporter (DMT)-like permease
MLTHDRMGPINADAVAGEKTGYNPLKGFLFALCGALLLSTNYVTVKFALSGFNPETLSLVWSAAALFYSLIVVFSFSSSREQIRSVPDFPLILLLGASTAVAVICGWYGLDRLDPTFASFLWRFMPALAILSAALFLHERLARAELIALVVMFVGGLFSVTGRWDKIGDGVIFTILAVSAMALQLFLAKTKSQKIHPNVIVVYRTLVGSLLIGLWLWISGAANFAVDLKYWFVALLGAFLGPCAGFLLIFHSYRHWSLSQSSIVLTIQPLWILPMAYLFLESLPSWRELTGGIIILTGAVLLAYFELVKSKQKDM